MSEKRRYDRPPSYTSQSTGSRGENLYLFVFLYFCMDHQGRAAAEVRTNIECPL